MCHLIQLLKDALFLDLLCPYVDYSRSQEGADEIARMYKKVSAGPSCKSGLSHSYYAEFHQHVTGFGKNRRDDMSKESLCDGCWLLKRGSFKCLDLPVFLKLLDKCILVKVLGDSVKLDSLDEVFTELHEWKPLCDALDQPLKLFGFSDNRHVVSDLLWQLVEICVLERVLRDLAMVLLNQDQEKLFV